MVNNNEKLEQNINEIIKQKEESDKKILTMEIAIGIVCITMYLILVMIALFAEMADCIRFAIIIPSTIFILIMCLLLLRIEQTAGYYECKNCHYKYVPTYSSVLWAMHLNRTRYMKCPECNQKSWQKKVVSKN